MAKKTKEQAPSNNPYINGKREWMERYGEFIKAKQKWQIIGIICIILAIISTMGVITLAQKSEFTPYIVEVDKLGRVNNVSMAKTDFKVQPIHIKAALASWIQDTRSVFTDPDAQRMGVEKSFSCLNKADPSYIYLSEFSKTNWQRSAEETVAVEIIGTPLPITNKSWQIEWTETVKSRSGELLRKEYWKGNFQIYFATPNTQKILLNNPLGIYIKTISWTKQHTENL